ncbi:MAG: S41 family peptidase [Gammaproteobacteria bacterium]|nr:S41 family peptidase [Gammaproteobacteria bacterium]
MSLVVGACIGICSYVMAENSSATNGSKSISVPLKDIQRFSTVIMQIKRYYIESINDDTLFENAMKGMVSSLDPHSSYLDEEDLKDLQTATTGKFGGIGVEIIPESGYIKVISPLDDTPAYKAGIKAGDLIIRIDNKLIKEMTMREAINLIRGKRGSHVALTILRKGEKKPLKILVKRDVIKVQTIKSKLLANGYGYIRIAFFQTAAKQDLENAVKNLEKQSGGQLKGLVLDLRNNPGGLLDAAIDVTDVFLDLDTKKYDGLIVYTKGRIPRADIRAKATPGDIIHNVPMIVLINEGSASASEIVAGALQDYKRAIIMGTRSFGKGSVQTVFPIDNTTALKLTTALYYTPSGRSIQAMGIVPDVLIGNLTVNKTDSDDILIDPINESDLSGHLKNGNGKSFAENLEEKTKSELSLAQNDFQLYQALMLLEGINAGRSTTGGGK